MVYYTYPRERLPVLTRGVIDMSQENRPQDVRYNLEEMPAEETNSPSVKIESSEVGNSNHFVEESRQAKEATRKLKKRMIIVLCAMLGFVVVAIPLIGILENISAGSEETLPQKPPKPNSVIFVEPDYDADIMKDPEYLELDRSVRLADGNITTTLDPKKVHAYSPAVGVLYDLVQAVIMGDADAYNALFSERYYAENDPEPPFTMQKVYEIVITKIREQTKSDATGKYTEYIYSVEYKIHYNDGTYRTDIGHDASRPQYFQLTDRENDKVLIDRLMYMMG